MKGGEITMVKHLTTLFQELTTKEFAVAVVISSFVSDNGIIKHKGKEVTGKDVCNMLGIIMRPLTGLLRNSQGKAFLVESGFLMKYSSFTS